MTQYQNLINGNKKIDPKQNIHQFKDRFRVFPGKKDRNRKERNIKPKIIPEPPQKIKRGLEMKQINKKAITKERRNQNNEWKKLPFDVYLFFITKL